jgi:amino acid adenylation domain-containing protein
VTAFTPFTEADLDQSIGDLFERQVARVPDRIAVEAGGSTCSYAELDVLANRLAHTILAQRSGSPAPICVLVRDQILQVAAIVGILKAGDPYLILEGRDPPARLSAIVADAEPALVLCDAASRSQANELFGDRVPLIDVDLASRDLSVASTQPGLSVAADALANLMYTSGSTGRPKGVMQSHRTLIHCVKTTHNRLQHTDDDRMALLSPPTVGVSAAMLFAGLLIGATAMPFDVRSEGLARLAQWLKDAHVTSTYSLPVVMRNTLALLPAAYVLPDLRYVKLGGEAVYRRDVELFRQHLRADCVVQVTLGTTETYAITWSHLDHSTPIASLPSVLPVGVVEDDTELLLLDDSGTPVADGEAGEIVMRSAYLSPGYWKLPELTRSTYLQLADGRREYHTGDLGRVLLDGNLQHLGRKDFLVKINGLHVTPAEVEIALREIDGVGDAAVVGHTDASGSARLLAYVQTSESADLDLAVLRERLAAKVLPHMVPSAFVQLERLPRLPNGKLDSRSLPSPDSAQLMRSRPYREPTSPLEVKLADIWREVLGLQRVGVDDDFAELGGDSLRAMQVLARGGQTFGVELPFDVLVEAHTVATLAQAVAIRLADALDGEDLDALLGQLEEMTEAEAANSLAQESASSR